MNRDYWTSIYTHRDENGKPQKSIVFEKGKEYVVSNDQAKGLLRKHYSGVDDKGKVIYQSYAELIEDLGIHIGRSKHIYLKDGLSKVTNKAV